MKPARRYLLGAAALFGVFVPWLSSCSADFDAPSRIEGLRVLAVIPDASYAKPGETVRFKMTWDAGGDFAGDRPQILWLGGCFNPAGDSYYGCFEQFGPIFREAATDPASVAKYLVIGPGIDQFDLEMPSDVIESHPKPATGENYGLAYVFFAICAGEIRPVATSDAGGLAGNFPLGCFDKSGQRIGADGFVPGYTQIYAFADGRENANPTGKSLLIKRPDQPVSAYEKMPEEGSKAFPTVECHIDEDARRKLGCGSHPFTTCTPYEINVDVDASISEIDPGSKENGKFLHEAVWVDWYTDGGDFDGDVSLLYDPHEGLVAQEDRSVQWIAPPEKGVFSIWGVLHDARGGASVLHGYVESK